MESKKNREQRTVYMTVENEVFVGRCRKNLTDLGIDVSYSETVNRLIANLIHLVVDSDSVCPYYLYERRLSE